MRYSNKKGSLDSRKLIEIIDAIKDLENPITTLIQKGLGFKEMNEVINNIIAKKIEKNKSELLLSSNIFYDRRLTPLEAIVRCLKEMHNLAYKDIALKLARNRIQIYNCYRHAAMKAGKIVLNQGVKNIKKVHIEKKKVQNNNNRNNNNNNNNKDNKDNSDNNNDNFYIPLTIFKAEESILYSIVAYLRANAKLSYHEIAVALNRNERTIWTVYNNPVNTIKKQ